MLFYRIPGRHREKSGRDAQKLFSMRGPAAEKGMDGSSNGLSTQDGKMKEKNRLVFVVLAAFLGFLGVHSYYTGNKIKALFQFLPGISVC